MSDPEMMRFQEGLRSAVAGAASETVRACAQWLRMVDLNSKGYMTDAAAQGLRTIIGAVAARMEREMLASVERAHRVACAQVPIGGAGVGADHGAIPDGGDRA